MTRSHRRRRIGLGAALVALSFSLGAPAAPKKAAPKHARAAATRSAAGKRPVASKHEKSARAPEPPLPRVAPVDFSRVKIQDFADEELDLPFYLVHFHELANGIDDSGPTRGFMRLGVWRGDQGPQNARVMENILSLAWFYTAKRPWNQYYKDPALRARLEAALDFWCRSQSSEGTFTQHTTKDYSLAPTAFAIKFVAEAMALLRGTPLDERLRQRALTALKRATLYTLTNLSFYENGREYTNQFGNVWGGGLALLELAPDKPLRVFLGSRFRGSREDLQSPAGFFYENNGPDWGYTLGTHGSNTNQAYKYMRGSPLEATLLESERRWWDWLAWNAVPEPDGSGFILNRSIETRRRHATFPSYESPLTDKIPFARALSESSEERAARLAHLRGKLVATFPRVPALKVPEGESFSPYVFLNRDIPDVIPSEKDRDAARAQLPSLLPGSAVSQRRDPRMPATFTFVRRPAYYAAFTAGKKVSSQERFGLGLLFNAGYGAVLQSQTDTRDQTFGTAMPRGNQTFESGDLDVTYTLDKKPLAEPEDGVHDVPNGTFGIEYALGKSGKKSVTFAERSVDVSVTLPGEVVETLPLLVVPNETVVLSKGKARVQNKAASCEVRFGDGVEPKATETDQMILAKRVVTLTLSARDKLDYSIVCVGRRAK